MGLHDPVDLHCGRTDPSLRSEPVNALSNAAFFVAAQVGWGAAAGEAAAGRPAGDLRTIDQAVCASFPLGTHFAWHLLNGLVITFALPAPASGPRLSAR